jgi:hypothetical protein
MQRVMMDSGGRRLNTQKLTRRLVRWSALGLGALFITAGLSSLALHSYGIHRLEKVRADLEARWGQLAQYEPSPPVPDHENGARWLMAGGQAVVCSIEDQKFVGHLSGRSAWGWTDTEEARARWILHEQQNALRILLRSGSFDAFHLGTNGLRTNYEEIQFLSIVKGLRLLTLEARLAWSEGRTSDSLSALNAISRAADGLLRTPIVMTSTTGSAATRWFARAAADIVSDPCAATETLEELRDVLPSEDPIHRGNITLAVAVFEIADERLDYIEGFHDPSMGWSIPFWVSNRYLLEDLVVAEILERWGRYLEIGQQPAAHWPLDVSRSIWGDSSWPPWLALTGTFTPNLINDRVRTQAASTELQQLRTALDLRLASPVVLEPAVCELLDDARPTALTGEPVTCRYDDKRDVIVIKVPRAEQTLNAFVAPDNQAALLPPIELPMGLVDADCE